MIPLEVDREQLREDAISSAFYVGDLLLFGLMIGLIMEIWQAIDLLPFWIDASIVIGYLLLLTYIAYRRYTVKKPRSQYVFVKGLVDYLEVVVAPKTFYPDLKLIVRPEDVEVC